MEAMATASRISVTRVSALSKSAVVKTPVHTSSASFALVKIQPFAAIQFSAQSQLRVSPICVVSAELEGVETQEAAPAAVTKLYVGNLPFNVDSQSLAELFQEAGVVEMVEVVYDRDTGRSRGFGFVTMNSPEDAQSAIERFDGSDLGGRNLKVNFPTPRGERPAPSERRGGDRGAPRRSGPSSPNKVFVGNLSWGMDDMALEDLFSEFGKVLEAKVVTDRETGRSRGFGFVTYASSQEMEEAVANLNGADVDGRPLRVSQAEKPAGR